MQSYIAKLKASTAEADRQREEATAKRYNPSPRVLCATPIKTQLTELFQSLPPALRDRPWTMDDLIARLHGRYKTHPSAGDVGQALRALGWVARRDWTRDGGGRRVWIKSN